MGKVLTRRVMASRVDLAAPAGSSHPDLTVCTDPPILTEVRRAIGRLKRGRAACPSVCHRPSVKRSTCSF